MKRLFLIPILLLLAPFARGAQTVVSAVITDPSGKPYAGGSGRASIVCPGGQQPTINGAPVPNPQTITSLDGFGAFSKTLFDTSALDQTGCGTTFAITDQTTTVSFTTPILFTVTGTSVNLSAQISSYAAPLPSTSGGCLVSCVNTFAGRSGNVVPTLNDYSFSLIAGILGHAQLPILLSADIPNNAASTSGNAATASQLAASPSQCSGGTPVASGIQVNGNANCIAAGNATSQGAQNIVQKAGVSGAFAAGGIIDTGTVASPGLITLSEDEAYCLENPWYDVRCYGWYTNASPPSTTGSISSGSNSLVVASAIDLLNGHGIAVQRAGVLPTLPTPPTPAVTPIGVTGGSTTDCYQFVFEDYHHGLTAAGPSACTTTAQATLGATTYSLTSGGLSLGIVTFTCSVNCPIAGQVAVTGFTGGNNTSFNPSATVTSNPTATTFTVLSAFGGTGSSAGTGSAQAIACNLVQPTGTFSGTESTILRTWVYRNSTTLVGVSGGQDPTYRDCSSSAIDSRLQPAYVPSTPPASAQAGTLQTTILSGAPGTTLTLANTAGTTVASQPVLHDNAPVLQTVTALAYSNSGLSGAGGTVYLPTNNTSQVAPFNSTADLSQFNASGFYSVKIFQQGTLQVNYPIIPGRSMQWSGGPGNATSFETEPVADITGNANVFFQANANSDNTIKFDHLKFITSDVGQSSMLFDEFKNGGGLTGVTFEHVNFSGNFAPAAIIKGGFNFVFRGGSCARLNSYAVYPDCIHGAPSSRYIVATGSAQIFGTVEFHDMTGSNANFFGEDTLPMCGQSNTSVGGGTDFHFYDMLWESITGPYVEVNAAGGNCPVINAGLFFFHHINVADATQGPGTALLDSSLFPQGPVTIEDSLSVSTGALLGPESSLQNLSVTCFNNYNQGSCTNGPSFVRGGQVDTLNNGALLQINSGSAAGAPAFPPLAPTSAPVSSGGSVPIANYLIGLVAFDPAGNATTLGATIGANVTTPGTQTITVNPPTLPSGTVSYLPYMSSGGSFIRWQGNPGCNTPFPAGTPAVLTTGSPCGNSVPSFSKAFSAYVDSSGLTTFQERFVGIGALSTVTSSATAARSNTIPDVSGPLGVILLGSLTTTSATSDNVTLTGMTASGHCNAPSPTNASAATNVATTYISAKTTNQITVTHTATSGMTFDISCSPN